MTEVEIIFQYNDGARRVYRLPPGTIIDQDDGYPAATARLESVTIHTVECWDTHR